MDKLKIIDELNKHKGKKYLEADLEPKEDELYIAYQKKESGTHPKIYVRLADTGKYNQFNDRVFPIFQGFVNDKTSVILISGSRGSGKTLLGSQIANDYHILNKNNTVWYVCSTSYKNDPNLKNLKYIKDFPLDSLNTFKILDRKIDGEITDEHKNADKIFEKYNNCLFWFDDCDSLNKETQYRIHTFFNLLLELGRKRNIDESNGALQSRLLNRELDYYITFNENLETNRMLNHYHKFNTKLIRESETYLIFDFKHKYCITNERIFTF